MYEYIEIEPVQDKKIKMQLVARRMLKKSEIEPENQFLNKKSGLASVSDDRIIGIRLARVKPDYF